MRDTGPWSAADTFDLAADTQVNSITYRNVEMTAAFVVSGRTK